MQPTPLFSVVIPLYNKVDFIRRSLRSVLRQSFTDFEIIVVDDGSNDGGSDVVLSLEDSRIRLIRQENAGVSVARNIGIAHAMGQWVAFLDADDEYMLGFLQQIHDAIKKHPTAGCVFASVRWMNRESQVNLMNLMQGESFLLKNYFNYVVSGGYREMHTSGAVVLASVFEKSGNFQAGVKIGEDSDLWLRIAFSTPIVHIPRFLSIYHMEAGDSDWASEGEAGIQPAWVGTYRDWMHTNRIPKNLRRSSAAYYQSYLLDRILRKLLRGEIKQAQTALWCDISWVAAPKKKLFKTLIFVYFPQYLINKQKTR